MGRTSNFFFFSVDKSVFAVILLDTHFLHSPAPSSRGRQRNPKGVGCLPVPGSKRREEKAYRPYSYRLVCSVERADDECISVLISASLKRLGESGYVGRYSSAHNFDKRNGMLMPPELILKKYALEIKNPRKYIRQNKLSAIRLSEKGVLSLFDGAWKVLSL